MLTWEQAALKAKAAIEDGAESVYLPLGMPFCRVLNYRAIKLSAFVFQSPKQRATTLKHVQKFEQRTGCGLEALTLRRTYRGSLNDLAEKLYRYIQDGGKDLTKDFNLTRPIAALKQVSKDRQTEMDVLRYQADCELSARIGASSDVLADAPTGFVINSDNLYWIG